MIFRIHHSDAINVGHSPPLRCSVASGKVRNRRDSNPPNIIMIVIIFIFRPNSSLPFQLISPLQLVIVLTCALVGLSLVLVSLLGLCVALKQSRISTGLVSHLYVFISPTSVSVEIASEQNNCLLSILLF